MRASTLKGSSTNGEPEIHEVVLHALPRGRHRVEWRGEVLIEASSDPTFDACRALLARGIRGRLQTRHAGSPHAALRLDIERGAKLATRETATDGPRLVRWEDPAQIASRCRRGSANTGISTPPVPSSQSAFRPSLSQAILESVALSPQLNSPTDARISDADGAA